MKQMIINVDLDGVVYNFKETSLDIIRRTRHEKVPSASWYFWRDYGMTDSEWEHIFRHGVESGEIWGQGAAIGGAVHYMHRLNEDGFFIRIVTHRLVHKFAHADVIANSIGWLESHNVPYHSIAFLGKESKASYQCDMAIDDSYENWTEYETHKIPCVFFGGSTIPGAVTNWKEAYDAITKLAGTFSDPSHPRSVDAVQ